MMFVKSISLELYFQVQQKQQLIIQKKNELKEIEDRSFSMTEHLKNIHQELSHCQVCSKLYFKIYFTHYRLFVFFYFVHATYLSSMNLLEVLLI